MRRVGKAPERWFGWVPGEIWGPIRIGGAACGRHDRGMQTTTAAPTFARRPSRRPSRSAVDRLVDATPPTRDRFVDLLRAVSIGVVVCWHWLFSITHRRADGTLSMPNPIDQLPCAWLATWLLQVMPLFFFVGGYANGAGWRSARRTGRGDGSFLRSRLRRLLVPVGVFVAVWVAVDWLLFLLRPDHRSVLVTDLVVFVPLWFLGTYLAVVLAVPATARLHERRPAATLVGLGVAVLAVDASRFAGVSGVPWLNLPLVFCFAHQLGYWYLDGRLIRRRSIAAWLALGGAGALLLLTIVGPYPGSLVATADTEFSNMKPPTAAIAAAAVLQAGLALLVRPAAQRWLARRRVWKGVVAANAMPMTVFCWHMTALVLALPVLEVLAGGPATDATGAWWLQRPLWLVLPGVVLAAFLAVFGRLELPGGAGEGRRSPLGNTAETDRP